MRKKSKIRQRSRKTIIKRLSKKTKKKNNKLKSTSFISPNLPKQILRTMGLKSPSKTKNGLKRKGGLITISTTKISFSPNLRNIFL